jgi:hypothetical protein
LNFPVTLLSSEEIDQLRAAVYREWSDSWAGGKPLFVKVHDCFKVSSLGEQMFPSDITMKAIYLVRNPLDICVSYAHFFCDGNYDQAAEMICDSNHTLPKNEDDLFGQLRQHIGNWSDNVYSWTVDADQEQLKIIKYEDMKSTPEKTFSEIVEHIGFPCDTSEIKRAIDQCQISILQKIEKNAGFKDRPYRGDPFFRKGEVDSWKNILPDRICEKIIRSHAELMQQFGYISSNQSLL